MRCLGSLLLPLLAWSAVLSEEPRAVLYNRRVFPPGWSIVGRASPRQRMHLLVAVKQQNLDQLEAKFWAVSDPKSPSWRQHLSKEDISKIVASSPEHMGLVTGWLRDNLSKDAKVTATADAVDIRCSVGDVERLFSTEIHVFVHDNGHTILRSMGAHSVPQSILSAIDFVEGVTEFPMHRSPAKKVPKPDGATRQSTSTLPMVAPQTLLQMYSVPADQQLSHVSQGPAEFQGDASFNKADLQTFFQQTSLAAQNVSEIVGPYDGTVPDTEATLDVQYLLSVGQQQVNWYWTSDAWMYLWSHNFFNSDKVPDTVSISWGWAEDQQCSAGIAQSQCQTIGVSSEQYVSRVNVEFQKIGLRGISLLVASGDSGANGRSDSECTDQVLHSSFPASSPYVTAVGATQLQDPVFQLKNPPTACTSQGSGYACASGGTEVAVSSQVAGFTSGGGFSTYTPMPAYQQQAVEHYLTTQAAKLPPAGYFNRTHRGFPDIAALGNNFLIYMAAEGGWSLVGGTSAAAPTVAGVMAYLNDLSVKKSGKTLGFLNPLLYQMYQEAPEAFTDVVLGDNKCTEDGCFSTCQGYDAAAGWDPVTGLGTPVADKMLAYLEKQLDRAAQVVV